jgi:SAM-dependent methyltransferase
MNDAGDVRAQQSAYWNGSNGRGWVETQTIMDAMFAGIAARLAETARQSHARNILDLGCGTGAVTLAAAKAVSSARLTGIDISEPMLSLARKRASETQVDATFICDDAETHRFEAEGADLILSRFGVMFFGDPVAAFSNIGSACRPGAGMHLYAWRKPADTPFMTTGTRAAAPYLDDLPRRVPNSPGQFGFEDDDYVRTILDASGWKDVRIEAEDIDCRFPAIDLNTFLNRLGPLPRLLDANPQADRTTVLAAVREAYDAFVRNGEVQYTAGCWSIKATRP